MNWRMCLNWKMLGALAAVGAGIWILAPGAVAAALPLLLLAACPLSMLVMMFGMKGMGSMSRAGADTTGQYTCPMHPQVRNASPGRCPDCGMELVPAQVSGRERGASPERLPELKAQLAALRANEEAVAEEIASLERERMAQAHTEGVLPKGKE